MKNPDKKPNFISPEMNKAWEVGGWRERFAMVNGHRAVKHMDGRKVYVFTYGKYYKYQEANGATYDVAAQAWVN